MRLLARLRGRDGGSHGGGASSDPAIPAQNRNASVSSSQHDFEAVTTPDTSAIAQRSHVAATQLPAAAGRGRSGSAGYGNFPSSTEQGRTGGPTDAAHQIKLMSQWRFPEWSGDASGKEVAAAAIHPTQLGQAERSHGRAYGVGVGAHQYLSSSPPPPHSSSAVSPSPSVHATNFSRPMGHVYVAATPVASTSRSPMTNAQPLPARKASHASESLPSAGPDAIESIVGDVSTGSSSESDHRSIHSMSGRGGKLLQSARRRLRSIGQPDRPSTANSTVSIASTVRRMYSLGHGEQPSSSSSSSLSQLPMELSQLLGDLKTGSTAGAAPDLRSRAFADDRGHGGDSDARRCSEPAEEGRPRVQGMATLPVPCRLLKDTSLASSAATHERTLRPKLSLPSFGVSRVRRPATSDGSTSPNTPASRPAGGLQNVGLPTPVLSSDRLDPGHQRNHTTTSARSPRKRPVYLEAPGMGYGPATGVARAAASVEDLRRESLSSGGDNDAPKPPPRTSPRRIRRPGTSESAMSSYSGRGTFDTSGAVRRPSTSQSYGRMAQQPSMQDVIAKLGPPPVGLEVHDLAGRIATVCAWIDHERLLHDDGTAAFSRSPSSSLKHRAGRIMPIAPSARWAAAASAAAPQLQSVESNESALAHLEAQLHEHVTQLLAAKASQKQQLQDLRLVTVFVEARRRLSLDPTATQYQVFADVETCADAADSNGLATADARYASSLDSSSTALLSTPGLSVSGSGMSSSSSNTNSPFVSYFEPSPQPDASKAHTRSPRILQNARIDEPLLPSKTPSLSPAPRRRRRPRTAPEPSGGDEADLTPRRVQGSFSRGQPSTPSLRKADLPASRDSPRSASKASSRTAHAQRLDVGLQVSEYQSEVCKEFPAPRMADERPSAASESDALPSASVYLGTPPSTRTASRPLPRMSAFGDALLAAAPESQPDAPRRERSHRTELVPGLKHSAHALGVEYDLAAADALVDGAAPRDSDESSASTAATSESTLAPPPGVAARRFVVADGARKVDERLAESVRVNKARQPMPVRVGF